MNTTTTNIKQTKILLIQILEQKSLLFHIIGNNLGKINFSIDNDEVIFDISADAVSGTLMIGEYGDLYQYSNIDLTNIKVQKQKCKNLDFYSGKVGDLIKA